MKKAFVITSAIDVDNDHPLTYSAVRSHFTSAERLRQTISSLICLDMLGQANNTIFLIDASENYEQYRGILGYQTNLVFVSVKQEFPEIFNTVRTHPNKSHCESLLLLKFCEKYKDTLDNYDYFFKMSGRYLIDSSFDTDMFNEQNTDKFFFKHPLKFDWNDNWDYGMVDRRALTGDDKLYQYSSVLYGFGRANLDRVLDIYRVITVFTGHPRGMSYDVETLLYFFTRQYQDKVVETDWVVYGWDGVSGIFLRY